MTNLTPKLQATPIMPKLLTALRSFSLLRTAAGTLGLKIGAAGLGFLNGVLLARLLGPAELGVYAIVLSTINFAATLAVLGLPMLATREAAALAEHGQWGQLKGFLRAAHRWTLLAVLAILGVSATLLAGDIVKPPVSWSVIVIAMALVSLTAFNQLRAAILRGLHWVILADIPELLLRPLVMLLLLAGVLFTSNHLSVTNALAIQLTAVGFALVVGTWWLTNYQPTSLKTVRAEQLPRNSLLESLPFLGIALLILLEGQVSLYLLGYLGGAEQAGLFQGANQLIGLIAIGLIAINMPLRPKLAAAWARGDTEQAQLLITETVRIGTGIALVGALIMMIFAETILGLYGTQYVQSAPALRILAIGQLVNAVAGPCGVLLMMSGHQREAVKAIMLALLSNVFVAFLTIPIFGVTGGALASAAGMIVWNGCFVGYAIKRCRLNPTILSRRVFPNHGG